jgi:hypothetical protein
MILQAGTRGEGIADQAMLGIRFPFSAPIKGVKWASLVA